VPGNPCCNGTRIAACALVVGVLFATLAGLHAGQSLDDRDTTAGVTFGFAPVAAVVGFAVGGGVGGLMGALWARRGLTGLVGMAFVVGVGGLLGLTVAGLVGAETRTVVEGTAVGTEFGATRPVLLTGAALGSAAGALAAWRLRPRPAG
jgi:hypothetical protein